MKKFFITVFMLHIFTASYHGQCKFGIEILGGAYQLGDNNQVFKHWDNGFGFGVNFKYQLTQRMQAYFHSTIQTYKFHNKDLPKMDVIWENSYQYDGNLSTNVDIGLGINIILLDEIASPFVSTIFGFMLLNKGEIIQYAYQSSTLVDTKIYESSGKSDAFTFFYLATGLKLRIIEKIKISVSVGIKNTFSQVELYYPILTAVEFML